MNRLITNFDGGFPLRLDDLRWLDDANRDTLKGLVKSLIGDATGAKLYGCEVVDTGQGNVWTCSEGWVYFNSEIYYVPAHQIVHSDSVIYIEEDIAYDASGNKTFEDAASHDTYEIRRAKLVSAASQPAGTLDYDAGDVVALLSARMGLGPWSSVGLNGSNVVLTAFQGAPTIDNISGTMKYSAVGKSVTLTAHLEFVITADIDNVPWQVEVTLPEAITTIASSNSTVPVISSDAPNEDKIMLCKILGSQNKLAIHRINTGDYISPGAYKLDFQITFEIT